MYIESNNEGVKITPAEKSWRLFHNGTHVINLLEDTVEARVTKAAIKLFVAATKEECEAEIARLNLISLQHSK